MKTFEIRKEDLDFLKIDAAIRIRDCSGFFDAENHRLRAMLEVANKCEVGVPHIGTMPDTIITLTNREACCNKCTPSEARHSYEPFYREVIRVGLLLEKLAVLIDPAARITIDYPETGELIGRSVSRHKDFLEEFTEDCKKKELSRIIPQELHNRIDGFLNLVIPPQNHMLGTCHQIWGMKKVILRYGFYLDWKTPAEENPHIIYD